MIIALIVALLLRQNFGIIKNSNTAQNRFESWSKTIENQLNFDSNTPPPLTVEGRIGETIYSLNLSDDESRKEQILRVLGLIRETNIFSIDSEIPSQRNIEIYIKSQDQTFNTDIPDEIASSNPKIQLLFKLLELQGTRVNSSAVALNN